MSDLISRQAAIDAVRELYIQSPKNNNDIVYDTAINQAHDALVNLTSAQPYERCIAEIKMGKDDLEELVAEKVEEIKKNMPVQPLITEPHWIPCSEKLPEANGRYLVTRGLVAAGALWNRIYIANYSNLMGIKSVKIWWQGNVGKSDFERLDDVLAWMPLPETYREEGE